jgi:hypothetical protein
MISLAEIRTDEMIYDGIIGQSTAIRDVLDRIRMSAASRLFQPAHGRGRAGAGVRSHPVLAGRAPR